MTKKTAREIELERHIHVLRDALQNAPHSTTLIPRDGSDATFYHDWYREQRGPALESTDPSRWKQYGGER